MQTKSVTLKTRLMAFLLTLVMVFGMLPINAMALEIEDGNNGSDDNSGYIDSNIIPEDEDKGDSDIVPNSGNNGDSQNGNLLPIALGDEGDPTGNSTVTINSVIEGLTITDPSGKTVEATVGSNGKYVTYQFQGANGLYTYSASGHGTGTLRISGNSEYYLHEVKYTLTQTALCAFKMRVVNTTDEELVYYSDISSDNTNTALLIPAYDYDIRYVYHCEPQDSNYCGFYGNLWVENDVTSFDGFKQNSFNLSDSRIYTIGRKTTVQFVIPEGATLRVEELVKFYRQNNQFYTEFVKTENGMDYYTAQVPTSTGGDLYYVVSKDGYMTTGHTFKATTQPTITISELEATPNLRENVYEANIITNGNASKFISLSEGETFAIWSSRVWQAINSITGNSYLEPDKHYYLKGDSVTVDEYGIVRAVKPGLTILAITYDALEWDDTVYGAIREDCVGVFAFMVGGTRDGVTTGLEGRPDLETEYFAKTITIDGVEEVATGNSTTLNIKPTAENSETISVEIMTVSGYPTVTFSDWKTVSAKADGSYDLPLYSGRNVVKVKAGDAVRCYVIHCVGSDVKISNATNPGQRIGVGDTITVSYSNVITPIPKLGAIYNPGYGDTVYLEGQLLDSEGTDLGTIKGGGTQYGLSASAGLSCAMTVEGLLTISNVRIHLGVFGAGPTTHLALSPQSGSGNFTGDDSPESFSYWCHFPDITFQVGASDNEKKAAEIVDLINKIGAVELSDSCKEKIDAARLAYDSAAEGVKNMITEEQLKVLTDAEAAYDKLLMAKVGENIKTKTVDETEYYLITNADELIWFSKLVNGLLEGGIDARVENANALLENDIVFNKNLLNEKGELTTPYGWREYTPIGGNEWTTGSGWSVYYNYATFRGIFDGQGHTIKGLYVSSTLSGQYGGFVGKANSATIKNLNIEDSYISSGANSGGVAGENSSGKIENVTFSGTIHGSSQCGGIIGSGSSSTIRNASFSGKLFAEKGMNIGGIGGSATGTIENCSVNAQIEAESYVGGIVGYASYKTTINKCSVLGTIKATNGSASGIVGRGSSTNIVENCYSQSYISATTGAYGISGASDVVRNCYAIGTLSCEKGIHGIGSTVSKVTLDGPSYYISTNVSDELENAIPKTMEEFNNGTVAALLGENFGQIIGKDLYPVFANDSNRVFIIDGKPVNASAKNCDALIAAIGNVAINGSENCFMDVELAQACYSALSDSEKANVTKKDILDTKQKDYDNAVKAIENKIEGIGVVSLESKSAIDSARADYDAYIERGGDEDLITKYSVLTAAEAEYTKLYTIDKEQKIENTIKIKNIDGSDFYEISNADQLEWFVGLVNGTLLSKAKNTYANAILTADIILNKDLIKNVESESGVPADVRVWNYLNTFYGIFDGDGHSISGMYHNNDSTYSMAFVYNLYGTVKNLSIKDSYFRATQVASIAYNTNRNSLVEKCMFQGKLYGKTKTAGLVGYVMYGKVSNCYVLADLNTFGGTTSSFRISGLVDNTYDATIENCYFSGTIEGGGNKAGIANTVMGSNTKISNCYYNDSTYYSNYVKYSSGIVTDCGPYSADQLGNGWLAYRLGDAFGQKIGVDPHPVFRTDDNTVFFDNDNYANTSVTLVISLISKIGTVAVEGSENCFANLHAANSAYNILSKEDQTKVTNAQTLTDALNAEKAAVKSIEAAIKSITPMDSQEKYDKLSTVDAMIQGYLVRGGDLSKISNYSDYEKDLEDAKVLPYILAEKSIKTRNIDGKDFYVITNLDQYNWFVALVNGTLPTGTAKNDKANAILETDLVVNSNLLETVLDKSGELKDDIPDSIISVTPMSKFYGIFDGNGHSISGLFNNDRSYLGIINTLYGTLKNLTVKDTYFKAREVGGLVYTAEENAVIDSCAFEGSIFGYDKLGGIVLLAEANVKVSNCYVIADMVIESPTALKYMLGGIVCRARQDVTIENCYVNGTFSSGSYRYGAILAQAMKATTTIKNCHYNEVEGLPICHETAVANTSISEDSGTYTKTQLGDGSLAYKLGNAFGQKIGVDPHPVFRTKDNVIYKDGDKYTNTDPSALLGDVNNDGSVDYLDANLIYSYYNGKSTFTEKQLAAADVNGDGAVSFVDATLVYALYNGKISAFPSASNKE